MPKEEVDVFGRSARLVVFTGQLSYVVRANIVAIDDALRGDVVWLVLLHAPRRRPARLLKNQWRNLKRNGWRWIPFTGLEVLDVLWDPMRRFLGRPGLAHKPGSPGFE